MVAAVDGQELEEKLEPKQEAGRDSEQALEVLQVVVAVLVGQELELVAEV
jgi:hypothetical protein